MTAVVYGPFARASDWYQAVCDGHAVVPDPDLEVATTGHRETLIRRAQDGFEHERLRMEAARAAAMATLAAARSRREHAEAALRRAEDALAEVAEEPTPEELSRRRYGEAGRNRALLALRRGREHDRRRAALLAAVDAARREVESAAERVLAEQDAVDREIVAARARVRRLQEHTHRRLAAYRRRLVRSHPSGGWVNEAMDVLDPTIPGWAIRGVTDDVLPDGDVLPPRPPGRGAQDGPDGMLPDADHRRIITLTGDATYFGSDRKQVTEFVPGYEVVPVHAVLQRRRGGGYRVKDLRTDATYRNGEPVAWAALEVGGTFDIGEFRFRLLEGDELEETRIGPRRLIAHDLCASTDKGDPRLSNMSFSQHGHTVLAVLGPSGAGKSSLFAALLGELQASGALYFNGFSLARQGPQLRKMIGYVPQQEHLHQTLTVWQVLTYADRLRRRRRSAANRHQQVTKVCQQLELTEHVDKVVGRLSGGQRKRVSVAIELVAEPSLLLLDEPTSGLDPGLDLGVMELLHDLSRARKHDRVVVVVTHSTDHLDRADQVLVVAKGGRPVYFGPPGDLPQALNATTYAELMTRLTEDADFVDAAAARYLAGQAVRTADAEVKDVEAAAKEPGDSAEGRTRRPGPLTPFLYQFPLLVHRQVDLLRTRASLRKAASLPANAKAAAVIGMPLLVAVFGGLLAAFVSPKAGLGPLTPGSPPAARTALTLVVTLCMLGGQALTYSDLVGEYEMIRREHRADVRSSSVVLAKWVVFAAIAILQAVLAALIFLSLRLGPENRPARLLPPWAGLVISLAALSVAAMSLGLLISAVSAKLEQAVAVATAVAIAQVALSGGTSELGAGARVLSIVLPSRWGLAAGASSVDLPSLSPPPKPVDQLWTHSTFQWATDLCWLGGLTVVFVVAAVLLLDRRLRRAKS